MRDRARFVFVQPRVERPAPPRHQADLSDLDRQARTVERAPKPTNVNEPSGRYTAPIPRETKVSPVWVPILMFAFLGIGTLLILLNYTGVLWDTSNWILIGGLALILAGIITATQFH